MSTRIGINGFGRIGREYDPAPHDDNEWGCTARLADLAALVGRRL